MGDILALGGAAHLFAEELDEVAGVVSDDEVGRGVGFGGVGAAGDGDIAGFQCSEGLI